MAGNRIKVTTQKYLDVAEVKEDVVIMRDGTLRATVMVSSINFALKSEDEQNAIISAYATFLNNLSYPIQIVIQSREMNIEKYLNLLREKEKEQTNELLKMQISDYVMFIQELISISKIMNKRFYIIIPYDPLSDKKRGFWHRLFDLFKPANLIRMKGEIFKRRQRELTSRVDFVIEGLRSMGLNSTQLDTQSLIELLFNTYNPQTSTNESLVDVNKLRVEK